MIGSGLGSGLGLELGLGVGLGVGVGVGSQVMFRVCGGVWGCKVLGPGFQVSIGIKVRVTEVGLRVGCGSG